MRMWLCGEVGGGGVVGFSMRKRISSLFFFFTPTQQREKPLAISLFRGSIMDLQRVVPVGIGDQSKCDIIEHCLG